MEEESQDWKGGRGMKGGGMGGIRWRIAISAIAVPAWMILILLYAFLWSDRFSLFQSQVILVVSFLAVGLGVGAVWGSMGMRYTRM